jgi:hypothetical protein
MMWPDQETGTAGGRGHEYLRTSCGRELTIGRLALGDAQHPAARVFVNLGGCPGCEDVAWAGLTLAEARSLARAILSEVAAAEREGRG